MNLFENLQMMKEMAYERGFVLGKLRESNDNRYEHLIKIYFFRDSRKNNFIDWCKEVANFSKLHKCNSKIKLNDIINILWEEPKDDYSEDDIKILLKNYNFEGYPSVEKFSYANVFNYLKEFHLWLSEKILNKRILTIDVADKVKELLNKYSIES